MLREGLGSESLSQMSLREAAAVATTALTFTLPRIATFFSDRPHQRENGRMLADLKDVSLICFTGSAFHTHERLWGEKNCGS